MQRVLDPFQFLLIAVSGWMNHRQLQVIEYLREENRVLREQLGGQRVRLNDNQRRRLAVKGQSAETKGSCRGRQHRHAGDLVGLASEADRPEVRRNSPSFTGSATYR